MSVLFKCHELHGLSRRIHKKPLLRIEVRTGAIHGQVSRPVVGRFDFVSIIEMAGQPRIVPVFVMDLLNKLLWCHNLGAVWRLWHAKIPLFIACDR